MTDKQPDPLRLADALEKDKWHVLAVTLQEAADLLRTQHAELERKDALLRKCLKHVASNISMTSDGTEAEDLYDAINSEISQ